MGYKDDFYSVDNIIGYTGDINNMPTVYFQRRLQPIGQGNWIEFGHITQQHGHADNVGREELDPSDDYTIDNEFIQGQMRSVERIQGRAIHYSRSIFVPFFVVPDDKKYLLNASIRACPKLKKRYKKRPLWSTFAEGVCKLAAKVVGK